MKLQNRVTLVFLGLILIPLILLTTSLLALSTWQTREIEKIYEVEGDADNLYFSAEKRFDAMLSTLENSLDSAREGLSRLPEDTLTLETLENLMTTRGGELQAYLNGQFISDSETTDPALQAYLKTAMPLSYGKISYYSNQDRQYLISSIPFTASEGQEGALILTYDISNADTQLREQIYVFLLLMVMVLLITALLLTSWLQSSLVRPLKNLQKSARAIRDGNLDCELEIRDGDDELSELCRDFEGMRRRLKANAEEQLQTEQDNKILISNISHDLKTPITAIKGYVEGIQDGVASSPEKLDKYIRTIYNKAIDMDRLVDELTLYSKIDTNRIPYNFIKISAKAYFADCADELKDELIAENIELNYQDLLTEDVQVIADPEQLNRVINNIISNSVKYMDKPQGIINIRVREDNGFIRVELEDNGKGIEARALPYIFDRFYRTDSSRNSRTGGSGIGLSIVKKIIEDHGGRIWAASRLGFGTTISFELRKYEEAAYEQDSDY